MNPMFLLTFALFLCGQSPARADRLDHLPGLNNPDYHLVESAGLDRPFHVYVRLPENYDAADVSFPIIYLLDGDVLFPLIASYHLLLTIDEPLPDAIIVGISYGTFDPESGNYRNVDYKTSSADGDGGADHYGKFLKDELMPSIEEIYRADKDRRIIFGQSRGGEFVLYTALSDPELFWGYIASNPSIPESLPLLLDYHGPTDSTGAESTDSKVFVSSASNDWPAIRAATLEWADHWLEQEQTPWDLKFITSEGETHAAGVTNVFRAGMRWLFSEEAGEED